MPKIAQPYYERLHGYTLPLVISVMDKVRRGEHRARQQEGDEILKGSKQLWLYNPVNLSEERLEDFQELLAIN